MLFVKLRLIALVSACIGYRYVPIFGACLLRAIVGGVWLICLIVGVGFVLVFGLVCVVA